VLKPRKLIVGSATLALLFSTITPSHALDLPKSFAKYATSPALANAGIIVLDPSSQEPVFSDQPDSLRAPASVLKLLSTTTAIRALGASTTFATSAYQLGPKTFALVGQSDPWLSTSKTSSQKYHRAFSPYLINKIMATNPRLRTITLKSNGVYLKDLKNLQKYFKGRLLIHTAPLSPEEQAALTDAEKLAQVNSPTVGEIVKFTLLWSDNVLADRLARLAAVKIGYSGTSDGVQGAFSATLNSLEVPTAGLQIFDGSGLSHDNRVSPRTIATLLVKIKDNPEFKDIVDGLPTAGETGTLKNRFVKDAPTAVGLVKAKTGWINNSVALAGYVDVGNQKYVFAVIADHVKPYERYRAQAREAIDKMLGTIAAPPSVN
jgi:D-alanyl-D-alanine carboxypeptidase